MKKVSLTFKITLSFITVIVPAIFFLYFVFSNLFQEQMLESEDEKATLIAQTIEPMIGMNFYLGLNSEIVSLIERTLSHPHVAAIQVTINNKAIYHMEYDETQEHQHVTYPVRDPVNNDIIGYISISYALDGFYKAFEAIKSNIIKYLAILVVLFMLFGVIIQRLLQPMEEIAKKVKNYKLGTHIDFSSIRLEPETKAIIDAFEKMIYNVKEHNIMLERYKYAVDESSIVSKTDLNGTITYVNDKFCDASGYSAKELLGSKHNIVRHADTKKKTFIDMWTRLKEKKTWKGVIKNKTKNGTPYYVNTTILPIFDENMDTIEYMSIRHDITKVVQQQEQITRQTTDSITGLPNRTKLEEDMQSFRFPKLALIALDNFNVIQDYYGRDIGNKTLIDTANMLSGYIVASGMQIYDLSSGNFALLAGEGIEATAFKALCDDILQTIEDYIVQVEDESFNIRARAGLTYLQDNAFANASMALHHAQGTKKDSVVYDNTDNIIELYENNLKWTKKIKNALKENRIVVYAQAIFEADALEANKYECLVRMISEEGELISPFFFLDIAKKSKLYLAITKRVVEISFEVFSKLPDKTFSINLSVEDLINTQSMDFLKEKINQYDIASRLILEIVESEGIESYEEILPVIGDLKALGCQISIDDFGTGYSNFAYLMQLNVDYIKIDGSLIRNIDHDKNSQIISKAILSFAKQLNLKTVAEFIHNEQVMQYAKDMGVDYLQGFHLGKPEPIEKLLFTK